MRSSVLSHRPAVVLTILASLFFGTFTIPDLIPDAEAATSRDKKKISKLKKTVKKLKRQLMTQRPILVPATPPFIEMVTVGNAGNAADPLNSGSVPGIGAVAAAFQIGKYEVTNAQYAVFLNAVAETDTSGLFDANMELDARSGITQFGTSPNFHYTTKPFMGDKPVGHVDFWDCCRFCNWLHNGMPSGLQSAGTTETGAYDLTLPGAIAGNTVVRSAGAKFFIPTEDQWYKAAYHQPAASGGDTDDYWLYPTKSNAVPTVGTVNAIGEITNDNGNIANYFSGADWDSNDDASVENGNVTTVGSGGPGSASPYGASDMAGNVWEWNETIISTSLRGLRGGPWSDGESNLRSSNQNNFNPDFDTGSFGFRVASP